MGLALVWPREIAEADRRALRFVLLPLFCVMVKSFSGPPTFRSTRILVSRARA